MRTYKKDMPTIFARLEELRDHNFTVTALSKNAAFEMRNGKLFLRIYDTKASEFGKLLNFIDLFGVKVKNYNEDDDKPYTSETNVFDEFFRSVIGNL